MRKMYRLLKIVEIRDIVQSHFETNYGQDNPGCLLNPFTIEKIGIRNCFFRAALHSATRRYFIKQFIYGTQTRNNCLIAKINVVNRVVLKNNKKK